MQISIAASLKCSGWTYGEFDLFMRPLSEVNQNIFTLKPCHFDAFRVDFPFQNWTSSPTASLNPICPWAVLTQMF